MQTAFLGDTAMVAAMVDKVHEAYGKDAEVHLVIKKGLEELFKHDKRVKSVITFDKQAAEKGFLGLLKVIRKVRRLKLDAMLNAHRSLRSGIVTVLSGAKVKVGFKEAVLSQLFTKKVNRVGVHEVIKNHALLEAYDPAFKKFRPQTASRYKLFAPQKSSINELNKISKEPYIVIAPGSKWHTKRWTKEGYINLAERILANYNHDVIFTGDKNDEALIKDIISKITNNNVKTRVINLAGKLNISDLLFLISKSSLVVTNDSAPQHIAVGFDVPVVAIFGPTTKGLGYYPFSDNSVVVEAFEVKCRPCGLHGHMKCPKKSHDCMTSMSPEHVYYAVKKFL
ncbi:MAG: glycosyltransferase family 9 protein [bacterium]